MGRILFWSIERDQRKKNWRKLFTFALLDGRMKKKRLRFMLIFMLVSIQAVFFSVFYSDALAENEKKIARRRNENDNKLKCTTLFQVENGTKYNKTNGIKIVNNSKAGLIVVTYHRHACLHRFHFYIQKIILWKCFFIEFVFRVSIQKHFWINFRTDEKEWNACASHSFPFEFSFGGALYICTLHCVDGPEE